MFRDKPSARKLRRWTIIAAIALGSVIATLLLGKLRFFQLAHLKASDFHFLVRGKRPTSNIVVIAIDQKSLNTFHELLMFWHPYFAEAMKAAAEGGAKVMGLDWQFTVDIRQYEPNYDQMLAAAYLETIQKMPVICAYITAMNAMDKVWPVPLNIAAGAFNQNAFANLTTDADNFNRNQVLIENPDAKGEFNRGLAFRVAEKFRGVDAKVEKGHLMWAGRAIPTTPSWNITINYSGPPRTFLFIPLSDFIEAARAGNKEQIRKWVGGKAVLLGSDHIEDRHPTPFYDPFSALESNTAGVEIQANTLRTLLDSDYLLPVSQPVRLLSLMLAAGMTVLIAAFLTPAQSAYWLAAAIAATAVLTHLMFLAGVMISTSELYLAGLISLLSSTIFRFLTAEKRGSFFQNAISVFVGKKFAAEISEQQQISLSGSRQLVTILFSDIRGFTAFCEEKDPALVVDLLNEYMGGMVKVIVNYHGNVNKFIGDGILAIFSDEDGTVPGDHALRAVRCGTEMVQLPGRFRTGVGIHTGLAVVGNVGSQDKMEYTVLGDTVNLASRLESLNKEMKTQLILSEATRELLNGQFETVYLGDVPIRGKTVPLVVHTSAVLRPSRQEPGTLAEKA
jgi:adenylate cyclase